MSGHTAEKRAALDAGLGFGESCGARAVLAFTLGDTGLVAVGGWDRITRKGGFAAALPLGSSGLGEEGGIGPVYGSG